MFVEREERKEGYAGGYPFPVSNLLGRVSSLACDLQIDKLMRF